MADKSDLANELPGQEPLPDSASASVEETAAQAGGESVRESAAQAPPEDVDAFLRRFMPSAMQAGQQAPQQQPGPAPGYGYSPQDLARLVVEQSQQQTAQVLSTLREQLEALKEARAESWLAGEEEEDRAARKRQRELEQRIRQIEQRIEEQQRQQQLAAQQAYYGQLLMSAVHSAGLDLRDPALPRIDPQQFSQNPAGYTAYYLASLMSLLVPTYRRALEELMRLARGEWESGGGQSQRPVAGRPQFETATPQGGGRSSARYEEWLAQASDQEFRQVFDRLMNLSQRGQHLNPKDMVS